MKRAFGIIGICFLGLAMAACTFATAADAAPMLAGLASGPPDYAQAAGMAVAMGALGVTAAPPAEPDTGAVADPAFVSSTGDGRTVNNAVRHAYRVLSDDEKATMQEIKDKGLALIELIDSVGSSRELSIAKTKTEEAVMWAVKHVTA